MPYIGSSPLTLDAKNRLSIPAKHQSALNNEAQGRLWVTKHPDGCLMILPQPAWDVFYGVVAALPMSEMWLKRIFLGNALQADMDSTGRILISPELREFSKITKDATLRGMGQYFELWDKVTYDAQEVNHLHTKNNEVSEALKAISF